MAAEIVKTPNRLDAEPETERLKAVKELLSQFKLHDNNESIVGERPSLVEVSMRMNDQIEQGLCEEKHGNADIKMYPTFVECLPTGHETGEYLVVDLGDTWLRILFFRLNGHGGVEFAATPHIQAIPERIKLGHGAQFFDYIIFAIDTLMTRLVNEAQVDLYSGEGKRDFPLGFTFSFPCRQLAINSAILTKIVKGFACDGVAGKDVVALFHQARDRKKDLKYTFHCSCLINDTVGCLTSLAMAKPDTRIGVIFGTGTNACYPERIERIGTLPHCYQAKGRGLMVINTEWGAFGSISGYLSDVRNCYDEQLDRASMHPGEQLYEKMIGGMFLGELVRLLLVDMVKLGLLLLSVHDHEALCHSDLFERNELHTKYLSEIENSSRPRKAVRNMMSELGIEEHLVTDTDCDIIQAACEAVSSRAADLAAAGIATLLKRTDPPSNGVIVVGVNGSLVRFHNRFRQRLEIKTRELLDAMNSQKVKFLIELSELDGSGLGPATVAAAAAAARRSSSMSHS